MDLLAKLNELWEHRCWADERVLEALDSCPDPGPARREYAHVLGAEETWLARLEQRDPRVPVWPDPRDLETADFRRQLEEGYAAYLKGLDDADLGREVPYTNSAGRDFETRVGDILLQVLLHGHYHRGKINWMLREAGCEPAPVDFIGFVRGVPAARTSVEGR